MCSSDLNAVTLTPASATTAYTLTLPGAVPGANSFVTMNTGGTLGYVSQTGGIVSSMIATGAVGPTQMASAIKVSSASSGSYSRTNANTFAAVTGVSVTIGSVDTSRLLVIQLQPDTSNTNAYIRCTTGSGEFRFNVTPTAPPAKIGRAHV